jgi:Pyridoxamine 5'-phosphate oxidase
MGKLYDSIDGKLAEWIGQQRVFFVATAPSALEGLVNVSPKGPIDSFRVLGPNRVAYLDLIGSGAETVAHLRDNGRIVVMFCAFDGAPRILRLHGHAEVFQIGTPRFTELDAELDFSSIEAAGEGSRAIIVVELERIADSCGFGVPLMRYEGERPQQQAWIESKLRQGGPNALLDYIRHRNAVSIDALPAFDGDRLPLD